MSRIHYTIYLSSNCYLDHAYSEMIEYIEKHKDPVIQFIEHPSYGCYLVSTKYLKINNGQSKEDFTEAITLWEKEYKVIHESFETLFKIFLGESEHPKIKLYTFI